MATTCCLTYTFPNLTAIKETMWVVNLNFKPEVRLQKRCQIRAKDIPQQERKKSFTRRGGVLKQEGQKPLKVREKHWFGGEY